MYDRCVAQKPIDNHTHKKNMRMDLTAPFISNLEDQIAESSQLQNR